MGTYLRSLKRSTLCAITLCGATLLPYNVLADTVTLRSNDGAVNLVGELTSFEDGHYNIETTLGDLRIPSSGISCEGDACPVFEAEIDAEIPAIRFAGSDTVGEGILPLLIAGYATYKDGDVETAQSTGNVVSTAIYGESGFGSQIGHFRVDSTTSGTAFKALANRSAEIGMASRRIKQSEAVSLQNAGAGNMLSPAQEHIVAVDSLVVVTHPENPVSEISMAQLRDVYTGRINNWRQLGGENRPIQVMTRVDGSATRTVFEDRLFNGQNANVTPRAAKAKDNIAMAAAVTSDQGAIGFVGSGFQLGAKGLTLVNECGMTNHADAFSAKTEEYPFQRRLYMYNRAGGLTPAAQDFLDFVKSTDADGVIAKAGFIDLSISAQEQSLDSSRARALLKPAETEFEGNVMREMLGQMVNYDRLSTTFRFLSGSAQLDERGQIDIERLIEFLEEKPQGTKVTLVGFTDSVGSFRKNQSLSIGRALQVREALTAAAANRLNNINLTHTGYGEVAPATCNTTDFGRSVNRRVEVWISEPATSS